MTADFISGISIRIITFIYTPAYLFFQKPAFDLISAHTQKRADNIIPHRPDGCHTIQPGTAEHVKKKGFRPVVAVMRHSDSVRAEILRRFRKSAVTRLTPRLLHRKLLLLRFPFHICFREIKGNAQLPAAFFHISGILSRFLPDQVIHMDSCQLPFIAVRKQGKHMEQADRIRPSGHSRHNPASFFRHMMFFHITAYFFYHFLTSLRFFVPAAFPSVHLRSCGGSRTDGKAAGMNLQFPLYTISKIRKKINLPWFFPIFRPLKPSCHPGSGPDTVQSHIS